MPLQSKLFAGEPRLEGCLVRDSDHVTQGSRGYFVTLIQAALVALDACEVDAREVAEARYGNSTAAAVLSYKQKRSIINPAYQTSADDIVGKMTIASLDRELCDLEARLRARPRFTRFDHAPPSLSERIADRFLQLEVERLRSDELAASAARR